MVPGKGSVVGNGWYLVKGDMWLVMERRGCCAPGVAGVVCIGW